MLVNQEFSNFGSSDPIAARTTLQTRELIGSFPISEQVRQNLVGIALDVQVRLIACREIAIALATSVDSAIARVGMTAPSGPFVAIPGVPDLRANVEMFLYQAKLTIRDIGKLYQPLVGHHFDQNFKQFADWASREWGVDDPLVQMLESDRAWVGRVISFRDAIEHPTHKRGPLTITNFTVSGPADKLVPNPPSWSQGAEPARAIVPDMQTMVDNLLTFYEELLAGLLMKLEGPSWLQIVAIPEADRDPAMPIRLRAVPYSLPPEA